MHMPNKQSGLGFRGVGHMLLSVPEEDVNKVLIRGMTPNWRGVGPKGLTVVSGRVIGPQRFGAMHPGPVFQPHHKERFERHMDMASGSGLVVLEGYRGNAFLNQGLQGALDSMYGDLVADRITHIGLSADTSAVDATTTDLDPAGNGTGTSIKVTANTGRTAQTVSADQTWTQADVSWAITKIGLLRGSASTDVSNIIGGTGGSSPYDEEFEINLVNIATWTLTMGIDVSATAS